MIEENRIPRLRLVGVAKSSAAYELLPDGTRLEEPTVRELANRLGWVTQPRFKEYDVSIYGAGPAGLSAPVDGASEGLRTVLIERHAIGGQAASSTLIENYMGFPGGISGAELCERGGQQAHSESRS
jgi:thioredoxin reductase (NADPH)